MKISIFTNGWNWSSRTVSRVVVMMMLMSGLNLYAQDSNAPDMALLEFLGEGVKVDKEVVDPLTWQAMEEMTGSTQDKSQSPGQTKPEQQQDNRRQAHE